MIPVARTAYLDATVKTASPARLLVMLLDRLVLDCRRAQEAQQAQDHQTAHQQLVHAQDIVTELYATLDVDAWDGGPGLAALYSHLQVSLVEANIRRDETLTAHCLQLVEGLAETWREAALQSAAVGA
ncbi:MAG TPA: flagellar export chaperone FliS [Candidatus Nanopelagicales bacterium]|nr:flagellar export chaperone FliS [Candidatus Nanopelagicales bacterium]